jgi:choline dehydrogenase
MSIKPVADIVVIGAGSAGCVLASRLSEDPKRRVMLVEAGPDYATLADLPHDVADASDPTLGHDWGFVGEPDLRGRRVQLPRARLVGGCSATNGCFALRGSPHDYDGWAALGNAGWSFDEVLPFFCRLETDEDFSEPWHGNDGPIPIRRHPPDELNAVQRAFIDAAAAVGHQHVDDHNRPGAIGVGPTPRNARNGVRMSTALTYLAAARQRPNLVIQPDSTIDRIASSGGRATGVHLVGGDRIDAGRVVLAAGAYASPMILARSGIGPAGSLGSLGIDVVVDLPGVGENLVDHPLVALDLPTEPGTTGPRFQTIATLRSSFAAPNGAPDLHLFIAGPFDVALSESPTGGMFGLVAGLVLPHSRGRVTLRSTSPTDPPRIDVAHLRHSDDLARMVEAVIAARHIAHAEPLAGLIMGEELYPGSAIADIDTDGLARSISERVSTYHHPTGTCRMGNDPDRGAVVDTRGRVHGIDNLVVADASIMPTIPSANTNLPTIMIAERIAAWLRE